MQRPSRWRNVLFALLVVGASVASSLFGAKVLTDMSTPVFEARASLYFTLTTNKSATDLNQGSTYVQSQIASFAALAKSSTVIEPVIQELGLSETVGQVANSLSITNPQNTVIIQIAAQSESAQEAADLANSVAKNLGQSVERIGPKDVDGKPILTVQSIESAKVPRSAASPSESTNLAIGGLLGLLLGLLIFVVLRRYVWKSRVPGGELAPSGGTTLGAVTDYIRTEGSKAGYVRDEPTGREAEQFRRLRENLRVAAGSPDSLSIVLAPARGHSELTVALELAQAFSETGSSVLVIDADLRNNSRLNTWNSSTKLGLADLLKEEGGALEDGVRTDTRFDFHVLPAGGPSQNPGKVLASGRMSDLVKAAQGMYQVVIIQAGSVVDTADAWVLAALTKGLVLTLRRRRDYAFAKASLDNVLTARTAVLGQIDIHPARITLQVRRLWGEFR